MSKSINSHAIVMFLKIGSLENITDLYENGTVYMNTLDYFKKIKDASLRGDENEGAISIMNPKNATVRLSFMDRDIKPINIKYGEYLKTGNLYSMYCISSRGFPKPVDFKFDKRNVKFGSHCLLIKQPGVFLEKIKSELDRKRFNYEDGFVEYYEEKEQLKDLTPFDKPKAFDYQKEFRFFVQNELNEPIKINIGSMKNYAEIGETKDLHTLRLTVNNKEH